MDTDYTEAATVSCGHLEGAGSDRGVVCIPPDPQATLNKLVVADARSRDHDFSNLAPVSSRTRRKLMLEHRKVGHEVEFADVHASDESSDEGVYYQTVAVGGRQGKLDEQGGSATINYLGGWPFLAKCNYCYRATT